MDLVSTVYLIGLVIAIWRASIVFYGFKQMKRNSVIDIFKTRPDVIRYVILKTLFWPFYFFAEKSPLVRFSETFFKRYGDKGHSYYGTRGLKNFLNDIIKGKERYQHFKVQHLFWELDLINYPKDKFKERYAEIIIATNKEQYLLSVCFMSTPIKSKGKISRFMLDSCESLSIAEIKQRLYLLNPSEFKRIQL